ncbi:hypothetical protein BP5796_03054 [Coleophoma crateriformis]|uniref:NB-ARC domain-containing protein n=1 Tax=Coleophoma crateriformis TaxID=565419 RepID=A0A3D8SM31_9HELO|nr:hypothetical protein BP5796_03054 [Coleophoma crateriformis]
MDKVSQDRLTSNPQYHIGGSNYSGPVVADHGSTLHLGNITNFFNGEKSPPPCQPSAIELILRDESHFVDRPEILEWVRKKCSRPAGRAALVGLGGVGKSQLAIQYAHDIREGSPSTWVFWVTASTRAKFVEACRGIADRLSLPGRHDPKIDVLRLFRAWLNDEKNGQWVMVLDSACDVEIFHTPTVRFPNTDFAVTTEQSLSEFLPQCKHGSILVTCRNVDVAQRLTGASDNIYTVPTMDEDQALDLFKRKLGEDSCKDSAVHLDLAADLVRALDFMPLAITQAASYISLRKPRTSISSYLRKYRRSDRSKLSILNKEFGDLRRNNNLSNSVVTTWQITFEQINQERQSAANLLSFMSFFNPHGIPESVLHSYVEDIGEDGEDEYDDDLEVLRGYSLVTVMTEKADVFEMQALVQFCMQSWLSARQSKERWKQKFLDIMSKEFPTGEYETWANCQKLAPHIESITKEAPQDMADARKWARLLKNAGWYQYKIGDYKLAEKMLTDAMNVMERKGNLGKEVLETLVVMDHLGVVLEKQCRYDEAGKWNRRALEGREKELGEDDELTLLSLSNFAMTLEGDAKYDDAEKMNRRALEKREKICGKEGASTIESMNNLASTLRYQAKYMDALKLITRACTWRELNLGKEHPDTIDSLSNWASTLARQGKLDNAAKMYREALARSTKALGTAHPDTLLNMSHLALVLLKQGNISEAKRLSEGAAEGIAKSLGSSNPDTLTVITTLATVMQKLEEYKKAKDLYKSALSGFEDQLGPHHPHTLRTMTNLAVILRKQGEFDKAGAIYQKAIAGLKRCFGAQHPDVLACSNNLAVLLEKQGKLVDAEIVAVEALHGFEKTLPHGHPSTLNCMRTVARLLHAQKKYGKAEEVSQKIMDGSKMEYGPEHPKTLQSIGDLAYLLHSQNRYHDAWSLYETACAGYEKLGQNDKASQTCSKRFGSMLSEMKSRNLTAPSNGIIATTPACDDDTRFEGRKQEETFELRRGDQEPKAPGAADANMKAKRRSSYCLDESEGEKFRKRQKM